MYCTFLYCSYLFPIHEKANSVAIIINKNFGRDVRTRLGVAISEVSGPPSSLPTGGSFPLSSHTLKMTEICEKVKFCFQIFTVHRKR